MKKDLISMLNWIRKKYIIGVASTSSFINLIPKEIKPTSFYHFWPILCDFAYKILTKILVVRVKSLLPELILGN